MFDESYAAIVDIDNSIAMRFKAGAYTIDFILVTDPTDEQRGDVNNGWDWMMGVVNSAQNFSQSD